MRKLVQLLTTALMLLFSVTAYASASEVWKSPTYNFKNIKSIQFAPVSMAGSDVANIPGFDKECEFLAMQDGRQRLKKLSFVKDGADVRVAIEVSAYDVHYLWYDPRIWTEEKTDYDYEDIARPDTIITDRLTIMRTHTVVHEQPGGYGWNYSVNVFITVYDNRTNEPIFRFSKIEDNPNTRVKGYYEIIKTFWKKFKDAADD